MSADELLREARESMFYVLENMEPPPEANCNCHTSPPCSDCVNYSALRESITVARQSISRIDAYLASGGWMPIETDVCKHNQQTIRYTNGVVDYRRCQICDADLLRTSKEQS